MFLLFAYYLVKEALLFGFWDHKLEVRNASFLNIFIDLNFIMKVFQFLMCNNLFINKKWFLIIWFYSKFINLNCQTIDWLINIKHLTFLIAYKSSSLNTYNHIFFTLNHFFTTDLVWSVNRSEMLAFFLTTLIGRKFWSEMPAFLIVKNAPTSKLGTKYLSSPNIYINNIN